jgi:Domain of Unknown Function (DUF1080)
MKKISLFLITIALATACKQTPDNKTTTVEIPKAIETTKVVETILTDAEKAVGFNILFNGKNTEGWHPFENKKDSTYKWTISEGILSSKGGHTDLVTDAEFENFDLTFEWKVGKGGNSGVMYMVQEGDTSIHRTWHTGIEYQLIDDKGWNGELHASQKAAAVYDLYDPKELAAHDAGTWNTARILNNKGHIQHFLNDKLIADYIWNSPDFKARVAKSKFKDLPFARKSKGHLAIQDHGQEVSIKNMKIKKLKE